MAKGNIYNPDYSKFPHFHEYDYTPSMPAFYMNAYTDQQVIKEICFELDKIINFLDSIVDRINFHEEEMQRIEKKCEELLAKCEELMEAVEKEIQEFEERIEEELDEFKQYITERQKEFEDEMTALFAELSQNITLKFTKLEEELHQFMEDVKVKIAEYVEWAIEKYITSEKVKEIIEKVIDEHWQEWIESMEMITNEDIDELFADIPPYLEVNLQSLVAIFYETNGRVELPYINKVRENEEFKFKVKAIDGYAIQNVTDQDGIVLEPDSDGIYTISAVTKNITITAHAEIQTKRITFTSEPDGVNIYYNIDGTQLGNYVDWPVGTDFPFTISTETEYAITSVTDNNGKVYTKSEGTYWIEDVKEDLTLIAKAESIYRFINLTTDNPYIKYFAEDGTTELSEVQRVLKTDDFKFKVSVALPRVLTAVKDSNGKTYTPVDGVYTIPADSSNLDILCETYIQQFDVNLNYDGVGVVKFFDETGRTELTSPVKVDCYSSLKTKILPATDHYLVKVVDSRTGLEVQPDTSGVYTFKNVAEDFNVVATSDSIYRQITISKTGVGEAQVVYDGTEVEESFNVEKGTSVQVEIIPATDHYIKEVTDSRTGQSVTPSGTNTYDFGAVNNNFTIGINIDSSYRKISFEADHATFTTEDGEEIESVPVELGSTYKFKIVNDYGFTIKNVIDNQGRLYVADTSGVYTSYEITDNITIVATSELYKLPLGITIDSKVAFNPAQVFGYGVWEEDTTGRIRRPAGNTKTGGSDTITISSSQMPSHTHQTCPSWSFWARSTGPAGFDGPATYAAASLDGSELYTGSSGSGTSIDNMQAYQNCFSYTLLRYS